MMFQVNPVGFERPQLIFISSKTTLFPHRMGKMLIAKLLRNVVVEFWNIGDIQERVLSS